MRCGTIGLAGWLWTIVSTSCLIGRNDPLSVNDVVARAWQDADFKARLLSDPHSALAEEGIEIDSSRPIEVVETAADAYVLVLPEPPANAGELSLEDLREVAGGGSSPGSDLMYG